MNKPRNGQVFNKNEYWNRIDELQGHPRWAFDFISVHKPVFTETFKRPYQDYDHIKQLGYSFVSPMCLVEENGMNRMEWERDNYDTKNNAIKAARKIARQHGVFVVYCD